MSGPNTLRDAPPSFFVERVAKQSNFAMEQVRQEFMAPARLGQECTCVLGKIGDLVTDAVLMVRVTKPSTAYPDVGKAAYYPAEWLVREVSVSVSGVTYDRHTSDWLRLHDSFFRTSDQSLQYARLTNWDASTAICDVPYTETLYLPLSFWFCGDYARPLPIAAAWHDEFRISVTFRSSEAAGIPPDAFEACMLVSTVYLDVAERQAMLARTLIYRPEVVQTEVKGLADNERPSTAQMMTATMRLNFSYWVKALWFVLRNTGQQAEHARFVGDEGFTILAMQTNQFSASGLSLLQTISEKLAPVHSASLTFDGLSRYDMRPGSYYNKVIPARYSSRAPIPGMYMCSFCLHPTERGYSGGVNLSNLDVELTLRLKQSVDARIDDAVFAGDNAERLAKNVLNLTEVHVYALTTRIIRVREGRCELL